MYIIKNTTVISTHHYKHHWYKHTPLRTPLTAGDLDLPAVREPGVEARGREDALARVHDLEGLEGPGVPVVEEEAVPEQLRAQEPVERGRNRVPKKVECSL